MLVLSRKQGESIRIGDDIEVKITNVNGGQVKIGITAPDDVTILREELSTLPEHRRDRRDRRKVIGMPAAREHDKGGRRE